MLTRVQAGLIGCGVLLLLLSGIVVLMVRRAKGVLDPEDEVSARPSCSCRLTRFRDTGSRSPTLWAQIGVAHHYVHAFLDEI